MVKVFLYIRRLVYVLLGSFDRMLGRQVPKIVIFCYHGIAADGKRYSIDVETFDKQMGYLSNEFEFLSMDDLNLHLKGDLELEDTNYAVITFDDGHVGLKKVVDIMKKYDIPATVFVLAEFDKLNFEEIDGLPAVLSNRAIRDLVRRGWTVGSHGCRHLDLTLLTKADQLYEIRNSKKIIERITRTQVKYFAYPYGKYDQHVLDRTRRAGYELGMSMEDGNVQKTTNRYILPRIGVDRSHSMAEFVCLWRPSVLHLRKHIKRLLKHSGVFNVGMKLFFR